jgi:hypothetical protein
MKILWNPNPLLSVVELDDADKKLLWHRTKIEQLEKKIASAHFDLDAKYGEWLTSIGKGRSLDATVAEALRSLDYAHVCGDENRSDRTFDEYVDWLTREYVEALSLGHGGDCTCVPCSCTKCHAEMLVGVDTIAGLGKHEASYIGGAFAPKGAPARTIDEAIAHLSDYEPKDVKDWGIPHVARWREEARRAHEWLIAYRREHFGTSSAGDTEQKGTNDDSQGR